MIEQVEGAQPTVGAETSVGRQQSVLGEGEEAIAGVEGARHAPGLSETGAVRGDVPKDAAHLGEEKEGGRGRQGVLGAGAEGVGGQQAEQRRRRALVLGELGVEEGGVAPLLLD